MRWRARVPRVCAPRCRAAAARLGAALTLGVELDFRVVCMGKLGRTVASNFEQYGEGSLLHS